MAHEDACRIEKEKADKARAEGRNGNDANKNQKGHQQQKLAPKSPSTSSPPPRHVQIPAVGTGPVSILAAAANAQNGGGGKTHQAPVAEIEIPMGNPKPLLGNCFACDVCKSAFFRTYEEAEHHENLCRQRMERMKASAANGKTSTTDGAPQEIYVNTQNNSTMPQSEGAGTGPQHVIEILSDDEGDNDNNNVGNGGGIAYEQMQMQMQPQSQSQSQSADEMEINLTNSICLSPIIRTKKDSPHIDKLSMFHKHLVTFLDMVELPNAKCVDADSTTSSKHSGAISFKCHFCDYNWYNQPWTVHRIGMELPTLTHYHLKKCQHMSQLAKSKLANYADFSNSGKMTFHEFMRYFCNDHDIVDRVMLCPKSPSPSLPTPRACFADRSDWEGRVSEKGIGTWHYIGSTADDSGKTTVQDPHNKLFNERCHQEYRKRVEMLLQRNEKPTISTDTFELTFDEIMPLMNTLSPFHRTAVEQLKFQALVEDSIDVGDANGNNVDGSEYRCVSIMCKHCESKSRLQDLSKWDKIVYGFAIAHLMSTCPSIPDNIKKQLHQHQATMTSRQLQKNLSLGQICDFIAIYYGFIDAGKLVPERKNQAVFVMFKPKPIMPQKRKADMDAIIETIENANDNQIEFLQDDDDDEKAEKNINSSPTLSPEFCNDKDESEHVEDVRNEESDTFTLVRYTQSGATTYLVPFGGVPLISSITADRATNLNRNFKVLLDNLEFVEERDYQQGGRKIVCLRCQNCNSIEPESNPGPYTKELTSTKDLYKLVMNSHLHLKSCQCTPTSVKNTVTRVGASLGNGTLTSRMKDYCQFLVEAYGLKDRKKGGVVWTTSKYELGKYSCKKLKLYRKHAAAS